VGSRPHPAGNGIVSAALVVSKPVIRLNDMALFFNHSGKKPGQKRAKGKKVKVNGKEGDNKTTAAHRGIAARMYYLLFSSTSFCLRGGPLDRPAPFERIP